MPKLAEPRIFRIFISYASEDLAIAMAIGTCLKTALGDVFAEVNLDKWFLQPGLVVKKQIEDKLRKTDVFIIVYTGAEKQSHGYTGWEVGYFDHVMQTTPGRLKLSLYLDSPLAISEEEEGIPLGLGRGKLELSLEQFHSQLAVPAEEPLCVLVEKWQAEVGRLREEAGFPGPLKRPDQDAAACVRDLKLAIFRYLKGTVETTVKFQKEEITIRLRGSALAQASEILPPDAVISPNPAGTPMAIFGLQDQSITWEKFLALVADNRLCDSWRKAITSVVMSSLPDRVNVDNSQIIVSYDEKHAFRIIPTTRTKFYDGVREFSFCFVEDRRNDQVVRLGGISVPVAYRKLFESLTTFFSDKEKKCDQYDKNVFIMTRFQWGNGTLVAIDDAIRSVLTRNGLTGHRADDRCYPTDRNLWDNVCTYMFGCKFGIAVLENVLQDEFNPNVALEYGFMRALGKPVLLLKENRMKPRADILGTVWAEFDISEIEVRIPEAIERWVGECTIDTSRVARPKR